MSITTGDRVRSRYKIEYCGRSTASGRYTSRTSGTARRTTRSTALRCDQYWKERPCDQGKEWASVLRTGGRPHQSLRSLNAPHSAADLLSSPLPRTTSGWSPGLGWWVKIVIVYLGCSGSEAEERPLAHKGRAPSGAHKLRMRATGVASAFLPDLPSATTKSVSRRSGWPSANYQSADAPSLRAIRREC